MIVRNFLPFSQYSLKLLPSHNTPRQVVRFSFRCREEFTPKATVFFFLEANVTGLLCMLSGKLWLQFSSEGLCGASAEHLKEMELPVGSN